MRRISVMLIVLSLILISEPYAKEDINTLYTQGKRYYTEGKYRQAIETFQKVLAEDPEHKWAKKYLESSEDKLSKIEDEKLLATSEGSDGTVPGPSSPLVGEEKVRGDKESQLSKEEVVDYYRQAKKLLKKEKFAEAITMLNKVLEIEPDHKGARKLLYQARLKQLERGEQDVQKLAELEKKERLLEVEKDTMPLVEERIAEEEKGVEPEGKVHVASEEEKAIEMLKEKAQSPVTLDFKDTDLREVIRYLVELTGVNIVIDEAIFDQETQGIIGTEPEQEEKPEGTTQPGLGDFAKQAIGEAPKPASPKVTIFIKDIPLIRGLDIILRSKGLKYKVEKDFLWVSTPANLKREDLEIRIYNLKHVASGFANFPAPALQAGEATARPTIENITGAYITMPQQGKAEVTAGLREPEGGAELTAASIRDILAKVVPQVEGSSILLYERLGKLIVRNTPSNLKILEQVLTSLDVSSIQVALEIRILEISSFKGKDLGIDWSKINIGGNHIAEGKIQFKQGQLGEDITSEEGLDLNYSTLDENELVVTLRALEKNENTSMLSAPKLTCLNNQTANIRLLKNTHYVARFDLQVIGSGGSNLVREIRVPAIAQIEEGIVLEVTPNVSADKKTIALTIHPSVVELTSLTTVGDPDFPSTLPTTVTRSADTTVSIRNGKTLVIGGLVKNTDSEKVSKVPILGNIPILGAAFRATTNVKEKSNLLIFITANILNAEGEKIQ